MKKSCKVEATVVEVNEYHLQTLFLLYCSKIIPDFKVVLFQMTGAVVILTFVLILCVIATCATYSGLKENFNFVNDVCHVINPENVTDKVLTICGNAPDMSSECTVGCDVDTLCRNPGIGYCVKNTHESNPALCDVTNSFLINGKKIQSFSHYRLFKIRRGNCIIVLSKNGYLSDTNNARKMLSEFPSNICIVKTSLAGQSNFHENWRVKIRGNQKTEFMLPLTSDAFIEEAKKNVMSPAGKLPVLYKILTSTSPKNEETVTNTDKTILNEIITNTDSKNQILKKLFFSTRFVLGETISFSMGEKINYVVPSPGVMNTKSPVSETELSSLSIISLTIEVDIETRTITGLREIIIENNKNVTFCKRTVNIPLEESIIKSVGTDPEMWLGIKDNKELFD
ncbi:hypothetical protein TetV_189 [Tetraselmis virus 1]|uniref:Uncharacterized protein n=1 Tax=Tetraselmis virus 1 TaxID=2060617 RepID=A0A2P0VN17_9VIRU|nr:hypothetical protein QJ968_gp189 [Tetraselmis virus 1]AUF82281.1 hypothetical protein TetV_189 [Tetraselmis virus 1]